MQEVIHYPNLKTMLMVEKVLKDAETTLTREEIKEKLPTQIILIYTTICICLYINVSLERRSVKKVSRLAQRLPENCNLPKLLVLLGCNLSSWRSTKATARLTFWRFSTEPNGAL